MFGSQVPPSDAKLWDAQATNTKRSEHTHCAHITNTHNHVADRKRRAGPLGTTPIKGPAFRLGHADV